MVRLSKSDSQTIEETAKEGNEGKTPIEKQNRRQGGLTEAPTTSRLPHDYELCVMNEFASHASYCDECAHPYETHKNGGTLCSEGHRISEDISALICYEGGRAYSTVDLEENKRIQLEIPADCGVVGELLKALEGGFVPPVASGYHTYRRGPKTLSGKKPTLKNPFTAYLDQRRHGKDEAL